MKYVENARVVSTEFLQKGICNLVLECPKIAKDAKPGQFIEIYPDNGVNLLSRPISICGIDVVVGNIRVVFQVVGKGTDIFSKAIELEFSALVETAIHLMTVQHSL